MKPNENAACQLNAFLTSAVVLTIAALLSVQFIYKGTSKPCDETVYLDKAHMLHSRHMDNYNYHLREWLLGKDSFKRFTPPSEASNRLFGIIEEHETFLKTFSENDDKDYRNHLALYKVHFAYNQNKTHSKVFEAVKRYMKSINIDRTICLEKFLAAFIECPTNNALSKVQACANRYDRKINELKASLSESFNEEIDDISVELKRHTTPGISSGCLSENFGANDILEQYKKIIVYRTTCCVPPGEYWRSFSTKWIYIIVVCTISWFIIFTFMRPFSEILLRKCQYPSCLMGRRSSYFSTEFSALKWVDI
ncbi:hypothetical protein QR680_003627 [Steinernema hermaphroditum]|uniref:Uncharacterized protein n=1 Tax=Steinernema hermaphroditum TaxID=289476 RepID=A0AA39LSN4_9BILA|nr:hypothetical protein QR680_003627 [Steinernema hermaphroditum]